MRRAAQKRQQRIDSALERVFEIDGFDAWLEQNGMSWRILERGEYGISIEQAQLAYVSQDPVLWCQAFLREPNPTDEMIAEHGNEDGHVPYSFWDYQRESIRAWRQDVIHQDGAEVGKTREITGLILWGECTGFGGNIFRPYILVGAPQQTHLDEIIMDIEEHVGINDDSGSAKPYIHHHWLKPKRTPHTMFRFLTPNPKNPQRPAVGRVYFRPAGHDGEAFRGVHVNALGLMDEAAKIKGKTIWSEFFRALKPGCPHRIYSVPDGDTESEFYRMCQEAVPDLPEGKPGLRLFHWAKSLMPPPFWTPERKQYFVRIYGGENTPGYQRNVLGLNGQQESAIWSWEVMEPNYQHVPEYRALKLCVHRNDNSLHVQAYRIELKTRDGRKSGHEIYLADRSDDLDAYPERDGDKLLAAFNALLREFVEPPQAGVYWIGADLGYAKDPTEVFVYRELGESLREVLRVHTRGMGYDMQAVLLHAIDALFNRSANWGVDYGNAGTMLVQLLQNHEQYRDAHYDERMTGFLFGSAVDCIDEDGEVLHEENRKGESVPLRLPAKQLATDLITRRFQRIGWALPLDNEVLQHYRNHTAKQGARHLIFSKDNDHTIDARRAALLRKVFNDAQQQDVFSSGVHQRVA